MRTQSEDALLRDLVNSRTWFHRIDLGGGIVTPGADASSSKLEYMGLPDSFAGKTVLDVGAYDGFFSFEAEKRGAGRVVATDEVCWTGPPGTMGDGRGFEIARAALGSLVERLQIRVEDLSPDTVGIFDYVLFLGVLYHAPDPLGYLHRVRSVCAGTLILETLVDAVDYTRPAMVFYPGATENNDPSNHWGPNELCVVAMLEEVGFTNINKVGARGRRATFHACVEPVAK
jgi:tRNA (mo5U34)-methyltransferase